MRYDFPFRRLVDGLVDLPFALPLSVAGITLTALYAQNGWLGQWLPFVVRTPQPVLQDLSLDVEQAAATLGASRWQTFSRVILPALTPALLTGATLAFARALGEYGSVIFIAGNLPMVSEITPLLIITTLEQYDHAGATALAMVMLLASIALLPLVNGKRSINGVLEPRADA